MSIGSHPQNRMIDRAAWVRLAEKGLALFRYPFHGRAGFLCLPWREVLERREREKKEQECTTDEK